MLSLTLAAPAAPPCPACAALQPIRPIRPVWPVGPVRPIANSLISVLIPAEGFGDQQARGLLPSEMKEQGPPCSFKDERGRPLHCYRQAPTINRIRDFINAKATVIEFGARYGLTTCEIAKALQNSGRLVSIEPDPLVWAALRANLHTHQCSAHVLRGGLALRNLQIRNESRQFEDEGDGTITTEDTNATLGGDGDDDYSLQMRNRETEGAPHSQPCAAAGAAAGNCTAVPHVDLSTLHEESGLLFDTIVADCEGCLKAVLTSFPRVLEPVHTVIFEADCAHGSVRQDGQSGRLGEAIAGLQGISSLHLKA